MEVADIQELIQQELAKALKGMSKMQVEKDEPTKAEQVIASLQAELQVKQVTAPMEKHLRLLKEYDEAESSFEERIIERRLQRVSNMYNSSSKRRLNRAMEQALNDFTYRV